MKKIAIAALVVVLALVLPSSWPPASAQDKPLRFVMSSTPSFTWLPFLVARAVTFEQLSRELGRKIDVTYVATPTPAVLGLIAGDYDFGIVYVQHAIKAQAEGKDLVVLAALMDNPTVALLARPDLPEIQSPRDMKGKVFGVVGLGSGHHMIALALAKAYNVNPDDVTFRSTGGIAGWIPAMRAKRVDLLLASEPTVSKLVDEGLGRVILDLHTREATEKVFGGPHPTVSVVARRDYAGDNAKITRAVVKAHLDALKWIHTHPTKDLAQALPEELKKQAGLEKILGRVVPAVSRTGEVSHEAVAVTIHWLKQMGEVPNDTKVDPAKVIDVRFLR